MSFYITLPSNSSMNYFSNNTLTQFSTHLHHELKLEGSYEVGLSEINYPFNWIRTVNGSVEVGLKKDKSKAIVINLNKSQKFQKISDLLEVLNKELQAHVTKLNSYFTYNEKTNRVSIIVNKNQYMSFSVEAKEFFGMEHDYYEVSHEASIVLQNKMNNINSLYIYTDIIDYQFVGYSFTALLRVVPVSNNVMLAENINCIVYMEHENKVQINKARNVIYDVKI